MSLTAAHSAAVAQLRPDLEASSGIVTKVLFIALLLFGIAFMVYSLQSDFAESGARASSWLSFLLLGVALFIALGFEFVNGFHDTANAVATVIYTHSLPAPFAVVWSGVWNFLGVLFSSGAVAFGIISLLPVELILQVGASAGFAMVFALLIAAILWNVGTWYLGLPASSSHTLIGSIIGVGLANQLLRSGEGTSGVDWNQALGIGKSLLFSPIIGFFLAGLVLLILKAIVTNPALYRAPQGKRPPPWWIRGLLILTCTGVSFAHGSNDGQKGMGLIMLILIGTVPIAYALNRAMPDVEVTRFMAMAHATQQSLSKSTGAEAPVSNGSAASSNPAAGSSGASRAAGGLSPAEARKAVTDYIRTRHLDAGTVPALAALSGVIADQVSRYGNSMRRVPAEAVDNVRNDMYLASEAIRFLQRSSALSFDKETAANLTAFKRELDQSTKFIPLWVKVVVAIALGLGTMVGWKRIVVTVGEKIGKTHLTYAQGASAEAVAMATIMAADMYGLPVSTTHVLSSGVAGTMAANGSGLQLATVRNLVLAWVLTLPAAILLAGVLYALFSHVF